MTHDYNKMRDIVAGLEIFLRHGGDSCDAQHDILYAAQGNEVALTEEEVATLKEHGWFYDSEACSCDMDTCFCGRDEDECSGDGDEGGNKAKHALDCRGWAIFT